MLSYGPDDQVGAVSVHIGKKTNDHIQQGGEPQREGPLGSGIHSELKADSL
jgi:hypothetical protein